MNEILTPMLDEVDAGHITVITHVRMRLMWVTLQ